MKLKTSELEGVALVLAGLRCNLVIDGTDKYGSYARDATNPPFAVFNIKTQKNVAYQLWTRELAETVMRGLLVAELGDEVDIPDELLK